MRISYRTVNETQTAEIIIKKSRFLGHAAHVRSEEEALAFVDSIRLKYKDATHNVFAWILGENDQFKKMNDDGEPQGTAGSPALKVLEREGISYTAVVVTRYFGGVKLGANGLIRAYAEGAKEALVAAGLCQKVLSRKVTVTADYTAAGKLEFEFNRRGYTVTDVTYTEQVTFELLLDESDAERFSAWVVDLTGGRVTPVLGDTLYRTVLENQ